MIYWLQNLPFNDPAFSGTLIGSVIGFVALIAGALYNFRLNRKRDDRIRRQEACSVAAALYGEILLLRRELALVGRITVYTYQEEFNAKNPILRLDRHFLEKCKLPDPNLYIVLASKLGLLNANMIIRITEFYAKYDEVRKWLPLLMNDNDRGYSYNPIYVYHPVRDAVRNVVPMLRSIEEMINISEAKDDFDLNEVLNAISMEEARNAAVDE